MKKITLSAVLAFLAFTGPASAQNIETDAALQNALEELTRDFNGEVGVYVYNLATGKEAGVNADTIFPTASVVKVPILTGVFQKIEDGTYNYHKPLVYDTIRHYGGSGLMQFFKDSTATDLRTLAALMITYSDNTTSLWLQELAGGGEEINILMEEFGLEHTRVNSRTEGRRRLWEIYGWGQTTPREMSQLLVKIRNREAIGPRASDEMYRLLSNSFYTDNAISQIPPQVQTASKTGSVNASRSELVMVNAPNGDYVFYFATKNNKDQSWGHSNEAQILNRKISTYLWNYFEPEYDWEPAEGAEELVKGME